MTFVDFTFAIKWRHCEKCTYNVCLSESMNGNGACLCLFCTLNVVYLPMLL